MGYRFGPLAQNLSLIKNVLNGIDTSYLYNEQYKPCPKARAFHDLSTNILLSNRTRGFECFGNFAPPPPPPPPTYKI